MKKFIICIFIFGFIFENGISQRWKMKRYEAIVGLGTINMFTDLGVSNTESLLGLRMDFTRPTVYMGARYKFSPDVSGKFGLAYGYGHSQDITNERIPGTDGFSSNTHLVEPAITVEYYLKKEQQKYRSVAIYNRRGMLNDYSTYSIYVFGGIAGLYYNAKYDFQPRPGDLVKESGIALALPIGVGFKYVLSDKIVFGYEIGPRYVFSDYLDGFKPPASKNNDVYWLTSFQLAFKIKNTRRNIPLFLDNRYRKALR